MYIWTSHNDIMLKQIKHVSEVTDGHTITIYQSMLTRRKSNQTNKIYYIASFIYRSNVLVSPNYNKQCNDLD